MLSAAEMREADRATIEDLGLPDVVLMESAGAATAREIEARYASARRIAILCGKGSNGGDGFVIARRLLGRKPRVLLFGTRQDVGGAAAAHLRAYLAAGGTLHELRGASHWNRERDFVLDADLVVDALLGTGLREAPRSLLGRAIRDLAARQAPVVAVDLPSGVASDTGRLPGAAVRADVTVTFGALKCGHVLAPSESLCGEVVVADIGIPAAFLGAAALWILDPADAAAAWGARRRDAHKGSLGHLLVIAGSRGKSGAAVLAGTAALRSGVGLVTVATPQPALVRVARGRPELMTEGLGATAAGTLARSAGPRALALAETRSAVVLGPGLGQHGETRAFVAGFVAGCPRPLVVDADGLNALAALPRDRGLRVLAARREETVLTPHPGEAARLLRQATRAIQAARLESARRLARLTGSVVVLKGHRSVVAAPSGRAVVNLTGNPGLATAGSGDVLSGIVGALLARGRDAFTAASAAVFVHGRAADRLAALRGEEGLLAGDVADALPETLRDLAR